MSSLADWSFRCGRCGRAFHLSSLLWRCPCGGLLDLQGPPEPLPVPAAGCDSPATEVPPGLWFKWERGEGTGTFKDRGAASMLGVAAALGVTRVVVDSSGNAGRAAAFYGRRLGLAVTVFVPASAPTDAIEGLGAAVIARGDREEAAGAARARVEATGDWYASHVYQPTFHHGVKALAYELAPLRPATVVVPAGNGTLVLGLWLGFRELAATGGLAAVPALVAVQAARCAPLAGRSVRGPTAASGIAIARPPRLEQVRAAVLASGGRFVLAAEADLAPAQADLAAMGYPVPVTSAAVWAALGKGTALPERPDGPTVVVLSGEAPPVL